ncbi:hypothetical protein GGR25_000076 [Kaistia hirudinis]|uniref:DUF2125 domain-containing protein n=1 Tax=Kaistia hirudinis TaxID=1293440 RepID=A0A840AJ57_9HYPH|nr:hypothetical protein [Kaistia hirudinis]MBB3929057.1 hypothetical protein [Kaistia hirudinis]
MNVSLSGARGLVLVSTLLLSTTAFAAPDATKIANSVVAALQAKGGAKASFDSASANGDDVVITNLKVSREGSDATVPSVVIASPVERTPGGFTAASISFDNGKIVDGEQTISWKTGISKDAVVPDPTEVHSTAKITPFSHFEIDGISVAAPNAPDPVTVDSFAVDLGNVVDGAPNEGKLTVAGINVPGSVLKASGQGSSTITDLGYDSLSLNVGIAGSYDAAKSALTINGITLDGKDMGKLSISGTFGGVPREKLQNADQLHELAPTATLEVAEVRFDDAGLTNRALDMQAKQLGAKREDLAAMVPGFLPLAFSQVNITDEAFQSEVSAAVSAYLKDPKSITVKFAPATPVLLTEVGKTALASPNGVLKLLGIGVAANN